MREKISEILVFLCMAFALLFMAFAVGGVFGMVVERTQLLHPRGAPVMAAGGATSPLGPLASPLGPPAQAAGTSARLTRIPFREFSSPDLSNDRSLEVPESPTLMADRAWDFTAPSYVRNPLRRATNVRALDRGPVLSETPTERSRELPYVVSKNEPVAADQPASEVPDNSRFASRYDATPSETIQMVPEGWARARFTETLQSERLTELSQGPTYVVSKNEPVAADRPASEVLDDAGLSSRYNQIPSQSPPQAADRPASEVLDDAGLASRYDQIPSEFSLQAAETTDSRRVQEPPRPRHVSSRPIHDQTMPWDQIDLRTIHIQAETVPPAAETTGSQRAQERPQSRDASPAPEQDHTMRWGPIESRTRELSDDVALTKLAPQPATTPQAMSADKKRAQEALQLGIELAQRRSFYSSHARFIEALQIVAQSLDTLALSNEHALALQRGLQAYEEAVDFQGRSDQPNLDISLNDVISGHETSVLHHVNLDGWNWEQCLQEYMSFAEREIVAAVGQEPLAAQALYGLGRLQAYLQPGNSESANVRTQRALMLHQVALIVDQWHHSAANELGVLLARNGQLEEAVVVLQHCVRLSPQATAWQNLAVVHSRLGQDEQAKRARRASEEARTAQNKNRQPVVMASGPDRPNITWSGWASSE